MVESLHIFTYLHTIKAHEYERASISKGELDPPLKVNYIQVESY